MHRLLLSLQCEQSCCCSGIFASSFASLLASRLVWTGPLAERGLQPGWPHGVMYVSSSWSLSSYRTPTPLRVPQPRGGGLPAERCVVLAQKEGGPSPEPSAFTLSQFPFTQDAEVLANVARKKWNTLLPIGVFTQHCKQLQATSKDLQANLRANLLTRPV